MGYPARVTQLLQEAFAGRVIFIVHGFPMIAEAVALSRM